MSCGEITQYKRGLLTLRVSTPVQLGRIHVQPSSFDRCLIFDVAFFPPVWILRPDRHLGEARSRLEGPMQGEFFSCLIGSAAYEYCETG